MSQSHDLSLMLASKVPIIVVETTDERRFLELLARIAIGTGGKQYRPVFQWSVTDGVQRLDIQLEPQLHNSEPGEVLRHIRAVKQPGIYVLLDFHPYMDDPINIRLLKDIALSTEDFDRTILLVSTKLDVPKELERLAARFKMALPDAKERSNIVSRVVNEWNVKHPGEVEVDAKARELLVRNLAGLTQADAERLARNAVFDDGILQSSDLPDVMQAKYELLNKDGVLSFEHDTARFSEVGGLRNLKVWLEQRRRALSSPADAPQLEPPRGLMLIGVQGCGKSLAAKATAGILNMPLLRLDFAALYNKYHGESERNIREALHQAEVMSPCVLWIDEIEKGLSTGQNDGGLSQRLLGTFLTWLAENKNRVFVVATANDVSALPPELLRKGRFDEIFFVDLPSPSVRATIIDIHLRRRDLNPDDYDHVALVAATDGFSGAELEQGVVSALYAAHAVKTPLNTSHLLGEYRRTRPLSVLMAEKIGALRHWAEGRTVAAD
jgi:SpoVK/Ycf46/Vps4 family AAA+-type ATPase